jgi:hypothetical protein
MCGRHALARPAAAMLLVVSLRCLEILFLFQNDFQPGQEEEAKGGQLQWVRQMENHWVTVCLAKNSLTFLVTGHCFIDVQMKNTRRPFVGSFWIKCTLKGQQYGYVNSLTFWLWGRNLWRTRPCASMKAISVFIIVWTGHSFFMAEFMAVSSIFMTLILL